MVKFNPGLCQISSKVFLSKNMKLELTKYSLPFTPRYSDDNTKSYSKKFIARKKTKMEQNFNPRLVLIGLSGTGPWTTVYFSPFCLHLGVKKSKEI